MKKWVALALCLLNVPPASAEEEDFLIWSGLNWASYEKEIRTALGGKIWSLETKFPYGAVHTLTVENVLCLGTTARRAGCTLFNGESFSYIWVFEKLDEAGVQALLKVLEKRYESPVAPYDPTNEPYVAQARARWELNEDTEILFECKETGVREPYHELKIRNRSVMKKMELARQSSPKSAR